MTRAALGWLLRNLPRLLVAAVALFLVLKWRGLEAENARLRGAADAGVVAELAKRQAEDRHAVSVIRSERARANPEVAALRDALAKERLAREAIEARLAAADASAARLIERGTPDEVAASLRAHGLKSATSARRPGVPSR